ncbi:conserved hypothetical protein [Histoplasma capsulatum var. duboisii H88]|uniref:Uncharacterized protein n=2 Tax=Ajellomyces capsulatus TaxID=5037 RepID=F0UA70_AJEC8|nr:conserved hypothetical protein [Histoplasma capsulatum H143]EGC42842.1 conserved hypothetical protein [Histoplasma capsulatum var. duboisii H88]
MSFARYPASFPHLYVSPRDTKYNSTLQGRRRQSQTPGGLAASTKASPGFNGKQQNGDIQIPVPEIPFISHEKPSEQGQTNRGKLSVKYATLKGGTGPPQVSRIPLPSPQPDGYPRRNTNAGATIPKSTTFSSFISLRHGSSLSRHQSLSRNSKVSCGQPNLDRKHQQQQIGEKHQKLATAANAQVVHMANNPPAGLFASQNCPTSIQQALSDQKGRSLPKSQTTLNFASYSKLPGYFAPAESFINRYQTNAHSKCNVIKDCEVGPLKSPSGPHSFPDARVKNACCSDIQQPRSSKDQSSMGEHKSGCTSPHNDDDIKTVATAKPRQYWLGRFSTLVNAFHHEDSFKEESGAVTGYDSSAASPYYNISQSSSANMNDQRVTRAFAFLENACTTVEARISFLEFRDAYSKCFGDRWTMRFVHDAGAGVTGNKQRHGGSTSDLNDGTLVLVGVAGEMADKKWKWSDGGALGAGGGAGSGGIGFMNMFRTVRKSLA